VKTSSTSSSAGELIWPNAGVAQNVLTKFSSSLEKDPARRATPWHILKHPWMVEMKAKRVDMVQFLTTVWDWSD
jgi:hypothetical protein